MLNIYDQLFNYQPDDPEEKSFKIKMLDLVDQKGERAFSRDALAAHFTASAWLINLNKREILLLKHKKLNKWLQPGGHADGELNLELVARKEVAEETNLTDLHPLVKDIFDIDIHLIPQHKEVTAHYHYDIRYAFMVENPKDTKINSESSGYKWVKMDEIKELTNNTSILRMVRKTQKILDIA